MQTLIQLLLMVLGLYLMLGVVFAVPFVIFGVRRIDHGAAEGTWGFKLLILPGSAVFWPILARRWYLRSSPPVERNPHRCNVKKPHLANARSSK